MRQFITLTSAFNGKPLLIRPYAITSMLPANPIDSNEVDVMQATGGSVAPGSYVLLSQLGTEDGIGVVETPEEVEAIIEKHAADIRAEDDARSRLAD